MRLLNDDDNDNLAFLKSSGAYFLANIIPAIISFMSLVLFTRLLAPEEYGYYYLIYSTCTLAYSFLLGGFGIAVLRMWPGAPQERQEQLLSTVNSILLLVIFCTALIVGLVSLLWHHIASLPLLVLLGFLVFTVYSLLQTKLYFLRADSNALAYGLANIGKAILALSLSLFFIKLGYRHEGALWGLVIGNAIAIIALYLTPAGRKTLIFSKANLRLLKQLLAYGLPLAGNIALFYVVTNTDRWLLSFMLSVKTAGLYSASYNLTDHSLTFIMSGVNLAAYPILVKTFELNGYKAAQDQALRQFSLFMAIVMPACFGFLLIYSNIASVVLGPAYLKTAMVIIPGIVFASFLNGFKSFYSDLSFQLTKHTGVQFLISCVVVVLNILLNLILIPQFGIQGSVVSSVIAFLVGVALSIFVGRLYFKLPMPWLTTMRVFIPCLIMVMVIYPLRQQHGIVPLLYQIMLGGVVYFISLVIFNLEEFRHLFANISAARLKVNET